jgi:hypothetical protein
MTSYMKAIALAAVVLSAGDAAAFGYTTCDGVNVIWQGANNLVRNTFSIADGGARHSAYLNGITRWNAVRGMLDVLVDAGTTSGSSITHGDGQNDVAVVLPSVINNAAGLTVVFTDSCDSFGDEHIVETDVMIASTQDFVINPDEATVFLPGRITMLHELGHAIGLNHFEDYNIMRAAGPSPFVGGSGEHAEILPDDAAGGRFLYPSGLGQVNVFASAQRRDVGTNVIANNTGVGPVFSCSGGGGQITIDATVGNNGTVDIKQTERWFVSTNKNAYGGTLIFQWNNSTYLANSALTLQRTMTMPALPVGTYFLFHAVDALNEHAESRESDNVAREALIIKVISC